MIFLVGYELNCLDWRIGGFSVCVLPQFKACLPFGLNVIVDGHFSIRESMLYGFPKP